MTPEHFEHLKSIIGRSRAMNERLERITSTLLGQQPTAASDALCSDPLEASYYSVEEMFRGLAQELSNVLFSIGDHIEKLDNGLQIDDLRSMMENDKSHVGTSLGQLSTATGKGKTRGNT